MVASKIDERTLKKEGVCAASLPTTMGIVAGLLVQNALKYLLKFGSVTHYLGYNALEDFFPTMRLNANPSCEDSFCRRRRGEFEERRRAEEEARLARGEPLIAETPVEAPVLHEDNDWGISLVDESVQPSEEESSTHLAHGLRLAYTTPQASAPEAEQSASNQLESTDQSLEELMAQMKQL